MTSMFAITYHPKVSHDLAKLDKGELLRIRDAIAGKLTTRPELYGARLRGELREYWKLRVGDYRIVYKIGSGTLFILAIGDRKEIYRIAENRGRK